MSALILMHVVIKHGKIVHELQMKSGPYKGPKCFKKYWENLNYKGLKNFLAFQNSKIAYYPDNYLNLWTIFGRFSPVCYGKNKSALLSSL